MVAQLSSALTGLGHHAAILSLSHPENSAIEQELEAEGIPTYYLGKTPGPDPWLPWRMSQRIREFDADVIHTYAYALAYALLEVARRRTRGVVHTVHTLPDKRVAPHHFLVLPLAVSIGLPIAAVSAKVASRIESVLGSGRYSVIPNGIPVKAFSGSAGARLSWRQQHGFRSDDFLFACVARLMPEKNHDVLLRAFANGAAAHSQLLLVGPGKLRPELEHLAEELNLSGRVHFLGLQDDIPPILSSADAFVLTSTREGNPLAVMEAMAAGLPVVATSVGGVPELVEDGRQGFLVRSGDRNGLAHAMTRLIRDPKAARAMGRAAHKRAVERFDVSTMARRYLDLYEQVVR